MPGNYFGGSSLGLQYRGTSAAQPPSWNFNPRDPTTFDINHRLGDLWMNTDPDATNYKETWVLVSLQGDGASKGPLAEWVPFSAGIETLSGDIGTNPVFPDANRNINLVGGDGIITEGDAANNSVIISSVAFTSSFAAFISADILNVTGAGAGYTIVFDLTSFNTGGDFDTSTGIYTAPEDGFYSFYTTVSMRDISAAMTVGIYSIQVTGTGPSVGIWGLFRNNCFAMQAPGAPSAIWRVNGAISLLLDAGDTVKCVIQIENGAANTAGVSIGAIAPGTIPSRTWFTGHLLSTV